MEGYVRRSTAATFRRRRRRRRRRSRPRWRRWRRRRRRLLAERLGNAPADQAADQRAAGRGATDLPVLAATLVTMVHRDPRNEAAGGGAEKGARADRCRHTGFAIGTS